MKTAHAIGIAFFLPLITTPWLVPSSSAWWGVPVWAVVSLATTALVALLVGFWMSRWWSKLADEAEAQRTNPTTPNTGAE